MADHGDVCVCAIPPDTVRKRRPGASLLSLRPRQRKWPKCASRWSRCEGASLAQSRWHPPRGEGPTPDPNPSPGQVAAIQAEMERRTEEITDEVRCKEVEMSEMQQRAVQQEVHLARLATQLGAAEERAITQEAKVELAEESLAAVRAEAEQTRREAEQANAEVQAARREAEETKEMLVATEAKLKGTPQEASKRAELEGEVQALQAAKEAQAREIAALQEQQGDACPADPLDAMFEKQWTDASTAAHKLQTRVHVPELVDGSHLQEVETGDKRSS